MELELDNELRTAQQLRPVEVGNASLAILGIKFNDINADGIRQPGEPGLRDIPILLEPAATANGVFNPGGGEALANSDVNGAFSFINLAPGGYRLTETVIPTGFRATTPNPLNATVVDRNVNVLFGNTGTPDSRIIGCKYLDLDNDGFRDGDEPGIKNVRIYLDLNGNGQREAGEPNTLTGKNGAWSFNVAAGTYKVREERIRPEVNNGLRTEDRSIPPLAEPLETNDFIQSTPPDNVPALDVTVRAGETFACAQVGNTPLYQIEVNKFQDIDRSGSRNVVNGVLEPPVNLVPFILDLNNNGRWDQASEPIQLTGRSTDRGIVRDGIAVFGDLFADNYSVLEIFPATLSRDLLPAGTTLPNELVIPGRTDVFRPANFNLPVATTGNPTLVSAPGPQARFQGTISREQPLLVQDTNYALRGNDPRFVDTNFDGIQNPGERAIAATGERPIFANTPVAVREPSPPLLRFSNVRPNSGNDINSPVGNTRPNITVFKYNDLNGNRRFEPEQGEAGINGVQVFLDLNNDGRLQPGEPTRTTQDLSPGVRPDIVGAANRAGRTVFENLAPGTYSVREVVPAGFSPSTADNVSVSLSGQDADVTFANTPNSKITGCKFEDFNQNGYRDGNEPAIANVTIFIDSNRDGVLQANEPTTTSDRFGTFSFGNLRPGNYSLREVTPPGFFQTTQPLDISLGPNQVFTCALVGNSRYYDLKVPKFRDDNRNGVRDGNEVPLAGIPFVLDLNKNGRFDRGVDSEVVRTDANGIALFPDLLPGTYSVLEVFNDPTVPNSFPIQTGPNPVSFNVPDPNNQYTMPSPPRPSQARTAASLDPLTEGGLDATVKASSIDTSLIAGDAGISFVDDMSLSSTASALTVVLPEDKKDLLLGAPASSPTGF
ncbi:SdrD B-like domain-containing protein [Tychonema sp. BBK16]|uniref:SdrD B-like domain-containing protein n=1 Tax=Tychonema sp. BBK16 TaxID=2699888 RepID=UPI001F29FBFC|nr:SdrD B-like domain-containing protein [Tychonema sp. BBK16]MCF6371668.1 hypothetical protein [Tychonema sp. BBK16]